MYRDYKLPRKTLKQIRLELGIPKDIRIRV